MDVERKTVQEHHDRSVRRPLLVISDAENAGIDMAKRLHPV
jgi:hypothetical protein